MVCPILSIYQVILHFTFTILELLILEVSPHFGNLQLTFILLPLYIN